MNYLNLHQEALTRVKQYNQSVMGLLDILEKLDAAKVYLFMGYPSLWSYATSGLTLSESDAYRLISVMRKSRQVPLLKEAISNGELSLPKAARIAPLLEEKTQVDWIEKAKGLSSRELEIEVVKASPRKVVREFTKPINAETVEVRLNLSNETHQKLARVKEVLSQKKKRPISTEEAMQVMADRFLEKEDPLKKAERSLSTLKVKPAPKETKRSRYVPAKSKHQVQLREQGQCKETLPNGQKCKERQFLQLHHQNHYAKGGSHQPHNLELLCYGHHKAKHLPTVSFGK